MSLRFRPPILAFPHKGGRDPLWESGERTMWEASNSVSPGRRWLGDLRARRLPRTLKQRITSTASTGALPMLPTAKARLPRP